MSVDDHDLLRSGIAMVVNAQPDMALVAEATSGLAAVTQFRKHQPDVTLMDLRMRDMDGIEAMVAIRREYPNARIVLLTTFPGDVQAVRALRAGAAGYLLKDALRTDLVDTIRAVHAGQRRIPPDIALAIADHAGEEGLTLREIQVLELVSEGFANREIAQALSLSDETVKTHMRAIMAKLGARDRTHAVTIALKRGILAS